MKPGIEPATPGLQGKRFIHYTTAAPVDVNMTSFQHVPVCVFFELYNLFDTVTFQTVYICRLTDNQICETKDLLYLDNNSILLLATPAAADIGLRMVEKYHTTAIYIHFA